MQAPTATASYASTLTQLGSNLHRLLRARLGAMGRSSPESELTAIKVGYLFLTFQTAQAGVVQATVHACLVLARHLLTLLALRYELKFKKAC